MPVHPDAAMLAGFAAGFVSGGTVALALRGLPRPERPPAPAPAGPFLRGRLVAFDVESLIRTQPVEFRRAEDDRWKPDPETLLSLLDLIRRETIATGRIPDNGIALTARKCAQHGITRATWGKLINHVMEPPVIGYRHGGTVWLRQSAAARFVERGKRAGKV